MIGVITRHGKNAAKKKENIPEPMPDGMPGIVMATATCCP